MAGKAIRELFFELRARTQGLEEDLRFAERRLGQTAKWVMANPVVAVGAVGAAFVTAGLAAAKFAEDHDKAMRRVGAATGATVEQLRALSRAQRELAVETGRSIEELDAAAQAVARKGVQSPEEITQRLRAAAVAAKATGEEIGAVLEGLDQALDTFSLTSDRSGEVLGKLFAASRGKASLEELFEGIAKATPLIRANRMELDQFARVLSAAIDRGYGGKKLAPFLESLNATDFTRLATEAPRVAHGLDQMVAAAERAETPSDRFARTWASIKDTFLEVGTVALPAVEGGLRAFTDAWMGAKSAIGGMTVKDYLRVLRQSASDVGTMDEIGGLNNAIEAVRAIREAVAKRAFSWASLDPVQRAQVRDWLSTLQQAQERRQKAMNVAADSEFDFARTFGWTAADVSAVAGAGRRTTPRTGDDLDRRAQQKALRELNQRLGDLFDRFVSPAGGGEAAGVNKLFDQLRADGEGLLKDKSQLDEWVQGLERLRAAALVRADDKTILKAVEEQAKKFMNTLGDEPMTASEMEQAEKLIASLKELVRRLGPDTAEGAAAQEKLNTLQQRYLKGVGDARIIKRESLSDDQLAIQRLQMQAQLIGNAVTGALQLASAFGMVDEKTARVIQNLSQVGTNIPGFMKALEAYNNPTTGGSLSQLSEVAAFGLSIAGGLAGLLGGLLDDGGAERRRVLEENTAALARLTDHIGDLAGSNVMGSTITAGKAVANRYAGTMPEIPAINPFNGAQRTQAALAQAQWLANVKAAFAAQGLSGTKLAELAQALGITLDGTAASYQKLLQAIKAADLAAFTDTFAGSLARLGAELNVYNVTDPTEKLRRTVKVLTDTKTGIPALATAFAGLDLGNASDRAVAIARLQNLFEALAAGSLETGGANISEALQAIQDLLAQLRGLNGTTTEGGGQSGFSVSRSITESSAEDLIGLARSQVMLLDALLAHVAAIRTAIALGPQLPPATGGGLLPGAVIHLTVNVQAAPGSDATAIGTQVGNAAGTAILDALLGRSLALTLYARGQLTA